ncbi:MAG: hypothetical protein E5X88_19145 [Mesorhizobium sp.]|uniref:hypothetical protein n=1 Tax=Mesorhizobium sp. TaxID=1871066 RepID=UPI001220DE71|nr:hypothetical protein [Mesorhizobium sp.]TIO07160.1 MAG: hypothetical protein E5X88_19145 [Mesorhizobium sp.]TIP10465.1 MAG: hypothetical protein E5X73_22520 [Mesorhizobium sp.]
MKTLLCGVTLLAVIAMPAAAETPYDRNLEKAVMDIVAGKIGEIRGGFSYGQMPQLVVLPEAAPALPVATGHPRKQASGNDALVPAVERRGRSSRS